MPRFSARSRGQLATCHRDLRRLFDRVIETFDCTILEGHRSTERQAQLVREGKSKVRLSKHNYRPSLAVDVAPYPIDWENTERFETFAAHVLATAAQLKIGIRWGGDWAGVWDGEGERPKQTFDDLVHFEIKPCPLD